MNLLDNLNVYQESTDPMVLGTVHPASGTSDNVVRSGTRRGQYINQSCKRVASLHGLAFAQVTDCLAAWSDWSSYLHKLKQSQSIFGAKTWKNDIGG
jgi:hypothetical protein